MIVVGAVSGRVPGQGFHEALNGETRGRLRSVLLHALEQGRVPAAVTVPAPQLAARLEMCALAHAGAQADVYLASISRMVFNLTHNGEAILEAYPLSRVCKLSHKRMHAETAHAVRDAAMDAKVQTLLKDAKTAAEEHTRNASAKKSAQAIRCPQCKTQTGIIRLAKQMRAADEGMTTTCLCLACSWSWRLKG